MGVSLAITSAHAVEGVVLWVVLAIMYFVPSIVAFFRKHRNRWSVFVVNFFLGWSVIGWIVALALAVSSAR